MRPASLLPLSSKFGIDKSVKVRFWPWLEPSVDKNTQIICSVFRFSHDSGFISTASSMPLGSTRRPESTHPTACRKRCLWGYNPVWDDRCKITPVILHGVASPECPYLCLNCCLTIKQLMCWVCRHTRRFWSGNDPGLTKSVSPNTGVPRS